MDIVMWSAEEADAMHAGYKRRAGIPAAGTEPLFAAAMVGYRKAHSEAATEIERLRGELTGRDAEIARLREALERIADGSGVCAQLMSLPPKCPRQEIAATAIASGSYRESGERSVVVPSSVQWGEERLDPRFASTGKDTPND